MDVTFLISSHSLIHKNSRSYVSHKANSILLANFEYILAKPKHLLANSTYILAKPDFLRI